MSRKLMGSNSVSEKGSRKSSIIKNTSRQSKNSGVGSKSKPPVKSKGDSNNVYSRVNSSKKSQHDNSGDGNDLVMTPQKIKIDIIHPNTSAKEKNEENSIKKQKSGTKSMKNNGDDDIPNMF